MQPITPLPQERVQELTEISKRIRAFLLEMDQGNDAAATSLLKAIFGKEGLSLDSIKAAKNCIPSGWLLHEQHEVGANEFFVLLVGYKGSVFVGSSPDIRLYHLYSERGRLLPLARAIYVAAVKACDVNCFMEEMEPYVSYGA